MKKETFSGTIEQAYGKSLDTAISYEAEYNLFESAAELRQANEWPSDSDIVKFKNAQAKANARQKATVAALDAAGIIKPTLENDEQLRLREMVKILVAAGKSEAESRTLASATLGIEWASE
jgi:hypothetical protein